VAEQEGHHPDLHLEVRRQQQQQQQRQQQRQMVACSTTTTTLGAVGCNVCFARHSSGGRALSCLSLVALCCIHTSDTETATCARDSVRLNWHSPATMAHALFGMPYACGSADSANLDVCK
jgi:hypothetical protein